MGGRACGCGLLVQEPPQRTPPGPLVRNIGKLITRAAAYAPWTWRLLRTPVRRFFDRLAPGWDERVGGDSERRLGPLVTALSHVEREPGRALDIGTGTGTGAFFMADRYPSTTVLGIDLSDAMIAEAKAKAASRGSSASFEAADIATFKPSEPFDLVLMMNMPPFFEQVSRLVAPGGYVVSIASRGPATPFYTSAATLERGFGRRGIRTIAADPEGTYYVAARPPA
jgi:SAM-dependent methyltransferase